MQRSGVCSLGATLSVAVFSSWVGAATAETLHFRFNEAEIGADSDPTGLFSNDEVAEGGLLVAQRHFLPFCTRRFRWMAGKSLCLFFRMVGVARANARIGFG